MLEADTKARENIMIQFPKENKGKIKAEENPL